jgi:hypothetical protein
VNSCDTGRVVFEMILCEKWKSDSLKTVLAHASLENVCL